MRTYEEIAASGTITEQEIRTIRGRMNAGRFSRQDYDILFAGGMLELTEEQTAKGLAWLLNLWKSPTGKERKNNPFGYREQEYLTEYQKSGERAALVDFYDAGRYGFKNMIPVYNYGFEYYANGGSVSIIG